jgi:hypothetical protein
MAVKALVPLLVTMMLVTGVCNTLLTKYQVRICASQNFGQLIAIGQHLRS